MSTKVIIWQLLEHSLLHVRCMSATNSVKAMQHGHCNDLFLSAIGIILSSVRPSVCLSLWRCALLLSGLMYRAKSCTSMFLAGMFLFVHSDNWSIQTLLLLDVSFSHKTHHKNRVEENASVSFFIHRRPRMYWFIAHYSLLRTWVNWRHGLWLSCLSGFSFQWVHKWTAGTQSDSSVPADRMPKVVTTNLIVHP